MREGFDTCLFPDWGYFLAKLRSMGIEIDETKTIATEAKEYIEKQDFRPIIDAKLEEFLASGQLSGEVNEARLNIYNIIDYGAVNMAELPVGAEIVDSWKPISDCIRSAYNAGGGIVFVPRGMYEVSDAVIVPDNVFLIGVGEASEIHCFAMKDQSIGNYSDFEHPYYYPVMVGQTVTTAGSNCGVYNLRIEYTPNEGVVANAGVMGSVSVSNWDYDDLMMMLNFRYNNMRALGAGSVSYPKPVPNINKRNVHNIIVQNIYSNLYYAVQIEGGLDYVTYIQHTIDGVTIRNIYAPNAIVSMETGSDTGHLLANFIKNVTVDNVICAYFRMHMLVRDFTGGIEDVTITNLKTHYARFSGSRINITNLVIDLVNNSPFDGVNKNIPSISAIDDESNYPTWAVLFEGSNRGITNNLTSVTITAPDGLSRVPEYAIYYGDKGGKSKWNVSANITGFDHNAIADSNPQTAIVPLQTGLQTITGGIATGTTGVTLEENGNNVKITLHFHTANRNALPINVDFMRVEPVPQKDVYAIIQAWSYAIAGEGASARTNIPAQPILIKLDTTGRIRIIHLLGMGNLGSDENSRHCYSGVIEYKTN